MGLKRKGNLFSKITSYDNIYVAHFNARKGKSHYAEVKLVNSDIDCYVKEIKEMLENKTFTTAEYELKIIYEPKERNIYKLPYFPDRIIHHAIMQVLQPIWDKIFIYDLYSSIPGRGIHAGSYRLRSFLKDKENTQYCLKFDISKFYPSMNHDILLNIIKCKIKCKDTLWLLEDVIRSMEGVPIGNYLSQYFGNLYLNGFDHWIKEQKKMRYYLRYCDDGVILHKDKDVLKALKIEMEHKLSELGLTLNPKTCIFPVDRCGIDFLGYRHYRGYTLLRKSSARKFKDRTKEIVKRHEQMRDDEVVCSIMSHVGWLKHCNSYNLMRSYMYDNRGLISIMDEKCQQLGIANPLEKLIGGET